MSNPSPLALPSSAAVKGFGLALALALLQACGGGSGSSTPAPQPSSAPAPTPAPTPTPSATPTPTPNPGNAANFEIRTWVPPYSQSVWKAALQADTGGPYNPANTLTSIGGQFFQISSDGGVHLWSAPASDVQWTADFCHAHGIKFLICVTNFNDRLGDFDWNLAQPAFDTHRDTLINNLVTTLNTWSADGISIDFEGNVDASSRPAFATFIKTLGTRLHGMGKELTVAIFPYIWNAPAITWIGDWVGDVDGIDSMGYDALYGGPGDEVWNAYKWQQDQALNAGYSSRVFDMGMPGWKGTWGKNGLGTSVSAHLDELLSGSYNTKPTSICIWDAQFSGSGWLSADVWTKLHQIRTSQP